MSSQEHKSAAPGRVRVFVLTVSDTRTDETDTAGRAIIERLLEAGHAVAGKAIEPDEPGRVAELVRRQAAIGDVDAIITTGGTGLTSRDSTFEAIDALLHKRLPGFGELFRMLSYHDIGTAAMMSRACAGTGRANRGVKAMASSVRSLFIWLPRIEFPWTGIAT